MLEIRNRIRICCNCVGQAGLVVSLLLLTLASKAMPQAQPLHSSLVGKGGDLQSDLLDQPDDPIDVIALDPGHGGRDPGAMGPTGLTEKQVTLDLASRLADLLVAKSGMRVIMTRYRDEFVSLRQRTRIANNTGADLFVSLHVNATDDSTSGGFATYFLAEANNDQARAVAQRENASLAYEKEQDPFPTMDLIQSTLLDMRQQRILQESSALAKIVQETLVRRIGLRNRGVDQAEFHVLQGTSMPAILLELGFLSRRTEAQLLQDPIFLDTTAQALCEGIYAFCRKYNNAP